MVVGDCKRQWGAATSICLYYPGKMALLKEKFLCGALNADLDLVAQIRQNYSHENLATQ